MGSGIAQIAATYGHEVIIHDASEEAMEKAKAKLKKIMARLVEKGKISEDDKGAILGRISYAGSMDQFAPCGIVIEAIIENLEIKQKVFKTLESICSEKCILATNTPPTPTA